MRIVAHRTLVIFYKKHADAKIALEEWHSKAKEAGWDCFVDIKKDFNSVDSIGNQHFVLI